jgi:hypothetical protein
VQRVAESAGLGDLEVGVGDHPSLVAVPQVEGAAYFPCSGAMLVL